MVSGVVLVVVDVLLWVALLVDVFFSPSFLKKMEKSKSALSIVVESKGCW
jgi:hypothetical protein